MIAKTPQSAFDNSLTVIAKVHIEDVGKIQNISISNEASLAKNLGDASHPFFVKMKVLEIVEFEPKSEESCVKNFCGSTHQFRSYEPFSASSGDIIEVKFYFDNRDGWMLC